MYCLRNGNRADAEDTWGNFDLPREDEAGNPMPSRLDTTLERYDPGQGSFWPWLLGGLGYFCREERRRLRRRQDREIPLTVETGEGEVIEWDMADDDPYGDPLQVLVRKEVREILLGCLRQLSPEYQVVIRLHYYDGWSVAKIAAELQIGESLVKVRLFRARQRLRDCLRPILYPPSNKEKE
jgi:RNA polymerase sigma factor (sigma-70 family)